MIIDLISLFPKIRSSLAFSTLRILPLSGNIAWKCRSLPCLAEPPAESPSTMYSSLIVASRDEQSANLPGKFEISKAPFLRVNSRAFLAASRARDAIIPLLTMIFAASGFSAKKVENI